MRPEETRQHGFYWISMHFILGHFCGRFWKLSNFRPTWSRLGVCQRRDTEAAHLEGTRRVGATWAHPIAMKRDGMTWRCDLRSKLKKAKVDWWNSVDSGDWPWLIGISVLEM